MLYNPMNFIFILSYSFFVYTYIYTFAWLSKSYAQYPTNSVDAVLFNESRKTFFSI